jgi:hypothetical protein
MRGVLPLTVVCILWASPSIAQECDVLELFDNETYNEMVCAGVAQMESGDHGGAITNFQNALKIHLFEFPNFKLFSRLALAQHNAGDSAAAAVSLEKASMTLLVYTRAIRCIEKTEAPHFGLVVSSGGQTYELSSLRHNEIANIMCGAAYDYIYEMQELD